MKAVLASGFSPAVKIWEAHDIVSRDVVKSGGE